MIGIARAEQKILQSRAQHPHGRRAAHYCKASARAHPARRQAQVSWADQINRPHEAKRKRLHAQKCLGEIQGRCYAFP